GAGPARRADDRVGGSRPFDPRRPHRDRAHSPGRRLATRGDGRYRHRGLRARDRSARAHLHPAAAYRRTGPDRRAGSRNRAIELESRFTRSGRWIGAAMGAGLTEPPNRGRSDALGKGLIKIESWLSTWKGG